MSADPRRELWIHAVAAKSGGGLTYLNAVLPKLVDHLEGRGVRVVLLVPGPLEGVELPDWVEVRPMPHVAYGRARRVFFDQVVLPLWLRRRPNAVLFCSGNYSPLVKPVPTLSLVRNAIYYDDEFLRRELPRRRRLLRLQGSLIARGARGCAVVQYPTRAMRDVVAVRHPDIASAGEVNHYGVREGFLRLHPGAGVRPAATGRDGVTTFLYVLNYTLQKNVGFLLEALAAARKERLPVRVVTTCRFDTGPRACFARDRALIDENDLVGSGYLQPLGPTFGDDLVELYRTVDACVFPSFCESFGHPLVEAMAAGKPVVCADRPYARELCGDHAVYVDPDRPEQLVDVWRRWPSIVEELRPVDPAWLAETFSWHAHVARLLSALLGEEFDPSPRASVSIKGSQGSVPSVV